MKTLGIISTVCSLGIAMPLFAGVEMKLDTKDAAGAVTESVKLYAQSGKIRLQANSRKEIARSLIITV